MALVADYGRNRLGSRQRCMIWPCPFMSSRP